MKYARITYLAAALPAILALSACDRAPSGVSEERLAELERQAQSETDRRLDLERELEAMKLEAERAAVERERLELLDLRIANDAAAAENQAAAEVEAREIAEREAALAERERELNTRSDSLAHEQQLAAQRPIAEDRGFEQAGNQAVAPADIRFDRYRAPVADYGIFHDSLSSYGSWFHTGDYGYVWQPAVVHHSGWRPYTRGRWVCSDYGWTWMSDEPFGWATYHYGRWALLRGHGWIWVPGDEWAPAWVTWRESGSHIGWAPLPPETLAYRRHAWDSRVEVTFGIGSSWFNFIEYRNFGRPLRNHYLPVARNTQFYNTTVNITNIHVHNQVIVNGGPNYRLARQRSSAHIPYYHLDFERGGRTRGWHNPRVSGDRLAVSAPRVDADWNDALRPSRVRDRLQSVQIERDRPIDNEARQRFNNDRRERTARAETTVREWGGDGRFEQRRAETLEANRREIARVEEPRGRTRRTEDTAAVEAPATSDRRPPGIARPDVGEPGQVDPPARPARGERPAPPAETVDRPRAEDPPPVAVVPNGRPDTRPPRLSEEPAAQPTTPETNGRPQQRGDNRRDSLAEQAAEQARRPQAEQAEAAQRREQAEQAQRGQVERQRREQAEQAQRGQVERQRREQAEVAQRQQVEQAQRQQAEAAQRQQLEETQRRQQADRTQREQAAQAQRGQVERQRREQAEQAQRGQVERQRREQAEQAQRGQVERQRREQAEAAQRQQAERAQREQATQRQQVEQAQRQQAEQAQREQAERAQREQAVQRQQAEQAQRQQAEAAQRQQAERVQREQAAQRQQVERQRREQAEQAQRAQREQAERAQREQGERQRREQAEQAQRQQIERGRREQAERAQREQGERQRREPPERPQRR